MAAYFTPTRRTSNPHHSTGRSCSKRHREHEPQLGQPLCWECYDYTGHVLWQWHAPELWRRFTIGLQRRLAAMVGLSVMGPDLRCCTP